MRIAAGVEYNGAHYYGWQTQEKDQLCTIQKTLENALSKIADQPIRTICAGRTDAKVHASGQIFHFETNAVRNMDAWILGTNSYLPPDIRIHWAKEVPDSFHARYSATSRRYHYYIYNHPQHSALLHHLTSWCYHPLNVERMQVAANFLLGEHDFSSFRGSGCQAKSPIRTIYTLEIIRQGHIIILNVQANAFLHHMVRNIAGMLIAVGDNTHEPLWANEVLTACDRRVSGITASPSGLYLVEVAYPEQFDIPKPSHGPFVNLIRDIAL